MKDYLVPALFFAGMILANKLFGKVTSKQNRVFIFIGLLITGYCIWGLSSEISSQQYAELTAIEQSCPQAQAVREQAVSRLGYIDFSTFHDIQWDCEKDSQAPFKTFANALSQNPLMLFYSACLVIIPLLILAIPQGAILSNSFRKLAFIILISNMLFLLISFLFH